MIWLLRLLVRVLRRRRHREAAARIRALEVGLGLAAPSLTELFTDPDVLPPPRGRRERREWEWRRAGMLGGRARCGYVAPRVPVSAMGPLPEVPTRTCAEVDGD